MSGNGYGYYYPPPSTPTFPMDPNQAWSDWTIEQQQYNNSLRNTLQHPLNHPSNFPSANRSQNYYNTSNRHYQPRRFGSGSHSGPQPSWHNNYNNKRSRQDNDIGEHKNKGKKRKKPLSQNAPRKGWTAEEAQQALEIEKEFNKRFKNHSLIIKFPDQELNRDIVSKFHPSIESVHFQQPSTPRFCFVSLQENADADAVIKQLNKTKFGEGYLSAEYKKDREEDQNLSPEDIDPSTLYVGNLAQEITKEDMVKAYPKQRRIDIGYAKKMKYTRYAFVNFYNVNDSIEAFKTTHSTQMHSKSLIVRFRRLHGTVGMPGETKLQTPAKKPSSDQTADKTTPEAAEEQQPTDKPDLDLSVVKQEVNSSDDESPFLVEAVTGFEQHTPMVKEEVKDEDAMSDPFDQFDISHESDLLANGVKREPDESIVKTERNGDEDSDVEEPTPDINDINFSKLLNQIDRHSSQLDSLRKLTQ